MLNLFNRKAEKLKPEAEMRIAAMADGEVVPAEKIGDPVFAQELMGPTIAFQYQGDSVTVCSPADGVLTMLFPTGHAFGITMSNGTELLVHIGINTVESEGKGFGILSRKQGDAVRIGDPVIRADLKTLREKYEMTTMLIITNDPEKHLKFRKLQIVKLGEFLTEAC
jgi:PTS system glucose-specific IIA component